MKGYRIRKALIQYYLTVKETQSIQALLFLNKVTDIVHVLVDKVKEAGQPKDFDYYTNEEHRNKKRFTG